MARGGAPAGTVLMALAAAQFLMILDSSVMNVSIATVAEDVGTTVTGIQTAITLYTLVMASLVIVGGKLGTIIGQQARVRARIGHLRERLADHGALPDPAVAPLRLVVPRGRRRRPDPAGDRRARRGQLPGGRAAEGLRPGGRGRRDRRGRRPAHRRSRHDLRLVALGVRRRGRRRGPDPPLRAAHPGRAAGAPSAPRPGRRGALRRRPGDGGPRRPQDLGVGLGPAEERRQPRHPRSLARRSG